MQLDTSSSERWNLAVMEITQRNASSILSMRILPIQLVFQTCFITCNFQKPIDFFFLFIMSIMKNVIYISFTILAGNLLNRTLGLLKKNCQSILVADSATAAEGNAFKDNVENLVRPLINYISKSIYSICSFKI